MVYTSLTITEEISTSRKRKAFTRALWQSCHLHMHRSSLQILRGKCKEKVYRDGYNVMHIVLLLDGYPENVAHVERVKVLVEK